VVGACVPVDGGTATGICVTAVPLTN
jgi:hypothetical protein